MFPDLSLPSPTHLHHGIVLIGAGGVVRHGHMPAYRRAGFNVLGVASRGQESVDSAQAEWAIPQGSTDWRRILDLPGVEVVDVSYPFDEERIEIVSAAAERGLHILMQKPMAHSMQAGIEMVRIAEERGVLLAVNMNLRYCPPYRAAFQAASQGLLGEVYLIVHEMWNTQDSQAWFQERWYSQQDRFQILEYSVHHLDLVRTWMGREPVRVKAVIARKPGQFSRGEMIASILLEFEKGGLGVVLDSNASHPDSPTRSTFRIEGDRGYAEGEASGAPRIHVRSDSLPAGQIDQSFQSNWFSNGFAGIMGDLLCAIEQGREPITSGRDHLKTLDLIFKAYDSAERG